MNALERKVKEDLERDGWKVFNSGWPDFLCIKGVLRKAVEVKGVGDHVRPNQSRMQKALCVAGIDTEVLPAIVTRSSIRADSNVIFSLRLPLDTMDNLRAKARSESRTISSVVNLFLQEAVNGKKSLR